MQKKCLAVLWFVLVISGGVYADEWDFAPRELQYMGNVTASQFENAGAYTEDGFHRVSKLPRQVTANMQEALESYDLDAGDWFTYSCGYEYTTPKEIRVVLRITQINSNGTYSYAFFAWQRY